MICNMQTAKLKATPVSLRPAHSGVAHIQRVFPIGRENPQLHARTDGEWQKGCHLTTPVGDVADGPLSTHVLVAVQHSPHDGIAGVGSEFRMCFHRMPL
jgi:hypothetical protein